MTTNDTDREQQAILLIQSIQRELAAGTKHYDRAGRLLETPLEIIECLQREGGVTLSDR